MAGMFGCPDTFGLTMVLRWGLGSAPNGGGGTGWLRAINR